MYSSWGGEEQCEHTRASVSQHPTRACLVSFFKRTRASLSHLRQETLSRCVVRPYVLHISWPQVRRRLCMHHTMMYSQASGELGCCKRPDSQRLLTHADGSRQVTSDTQPATSLLCGQMAAPVTVGWLSLPVLCCMPACTRAPRHLLSDKALSPIHLLETDNLLLPTRTHPHFWSWLSPGLFDLLPTAPTSSLWPKQN